MDFATEKENERVRDIYSLWQRQRFFFFALISARHMELI